MAPFKSNSASPPNLQAKELKVNIEEKLKMKIVSQCYVIKEIFGAHEGDSKYSGGLFLLNMEIFFGFGSFFHSSWALLAHP